MTLWFTGCTHFNHARIIELAKRPFATVEEMNSTIIANWNAAVQPSDTVYLLGDICWGAKEDDGDPMPWLAQLRGRIVVIWGNHDKKRKLAPNIDRYDYLEIKYEHQRLVLFHYPIDDWNGRYKGWIHLHAHDHQSQFRHHHPPLVEQSGLDLGKPTRYPADLKCNRFRVGQDACGYRPVSFEKIMAAAKQEG